MLCDSNSVPKSLAIEKILLLRDGSDVGDTSVRQFNVPAIKFDCKNYQEMIDWNKEDIFEPVLTCSFSITDLENIMKEPLTIPKYPNRAQACERQVKETSRAASLLTGFEGR